MEKVLTMPSSSLGALTQPSPPLPTRMMMMEKKGRWRTRTRIGNPYFVGVKLYENRTGRKYCGRPSSSSSLFSNPASVLRIQATVATGAERKKEVTNNSAGKSRLLTPGQFLLDRLTQDIGVSSSGAMEELELERGVCNPFRKYTPERVRKTRLWYWWHHNLQGKSIGLGFKAKVTRVYENCRKWTSFFFTLHDEQWLFVIAMTHHCLLGWAYMCLCGVFAMSRCGNEC